MREQPGLLAFGLFVDAVADVEKALIAESQGRLPDSRQREMRLAGEDGQLLKVHQQAKGAGPTRGYERVLDVVDILAGGFPKSIQERLQSSGGIRGEFCQLG